MEQDRVFVIIVTFNGMRWIESCINSVLKCSKGVKVIVVDNASTDGTTNFVRNKFKSVLLIESKQNIGFGQANNLGLSYALKEECDYAFLLNQDALIQPDTLQSLVEVSKSNPEYGIISPIHLNATGNYLDSSFLHYIRMKEGRLFLEDCILNKTKREIYELKMINAAAWLLPVKTINIVGGFSPLFFLYGEDDNYCQRVLYHNLKIGFTPESFIQHDSQNNNSGEFEPGSEKYFRKFINRIKIQYANINSDVYKQFPKLKNYYLKKALFSCFLMNFEEVKLYLKKNKLVSELNFEKNITEERKAQRNYL